MSLRSSRASSLDVISVTMIPQAQLTMGLAKFSFATTSYGYTAPIPWTHLMSDNHLVAKFELSQSQNLPGSQVRNHRFKIVNGQELLAGIHMISEAHY